MKIKYKDQIIEIDYFFYNGGGTETILLLHGLACSKGDFLEAIKSDKLSNHRLIAFDFPGHGKSYYPFELEVDDLVEITLLIVEKLSLKNIILVGHSLGGLIGLLFTEKYCNKVKAFINVEGNLKSEDCGFSRAISELSFDTFQGKMLNDFKRMLEGSKDTGSKTLFETLGMYDSTSAVYDIVPSMVQYSDSNTLIDKFISLKQNKAFIYGSENNRLSYIRELKESSINVLEIPKCSHCPHLDNPSEFYEVISNIIK